jgi:hypothetical protein
VRAEKEGKVADLGARIQHGPPSLPPSLPSSLPTCRSRTRVVWAAAGTCEMKVRVVINTEPSSWKACSGREGGESGL